MTQSLPKILFSTIVLGTMACGGDSSSGIDPLETELVLIQGDGQYAPAGERLPQELVVALRRLGTQEAVPDIVLNLKQVSLRMEVEGPTRLSIQAKGPWSSSRSSREGPSWTGGWM